MKKVLLTTAAGLFVATSVMAQVNVAPKNWRFDGMQKGSATGLFIKEAGALGSNFVSQTLENGHKGFRYADNWEGGFSVANWVADRDGISYSAMTDAEKTNLDAFYNSFQIVDGGKLGNIMIYQGNASTETDVRAVKNTESMSAPNVYLVSQKDLDPGIYKISIPIRVILNEDVETADVNVYVGTSWWDGLPLAGSGSSDYANFHLTFAPAFNDYWTLYEYEVEVKENKDATYDFAPILTKLGLGGNLGNNAIVIFDDLKLEKMPDITLGGQLATTPVDWSDVPTGVSSVKGNDNVIVFANHNGIQVIDATASIEVYSAAGQLVNTVVPNTTLTTIPVSDKGIYIVKTGNTTRKVVY